MKLSLLMLLVFTVTTSKADNYYFSAISGDDSRSSHQAQNPSTPWRTLSKLNSIFRNLQPGDSILFKRGDTFYGSLNVNRSGSEHRPIVLSAYGAGNKPVITGFQTLTQWVNIGNGIYESYNPAFGSKVNMLVLNDIEQEMGRYPNSNAGNGGYLNFESHINNSSITDKDLNSSADWRGAELVVRTSRYIIDRTRITDHSGNTLSYSPALSYAPINRFGYFIQNDIRTLDKLGEWYYNPHTKMMNMYFGSKAPSDFIVKASTIDNVVTMYGNDNIVMDNLNIMGGNNYSVLLYSTKNTLIKNCEVNFTGIDGISANDPIGIIIENSTVINSNNTGINIYHSLNGIVRNNKVKNSGILKGMGQNHANKSLGIRETGKRNLIEYNEVEASGYIGIRFGGDYTTIKNNFVKDFNLTKDDGGGIYTTDNGWARKITGNIIINGNGGAVGTNNVLSSATYGIYLDDDANRVEVTDNTIANCNRSGIFLHNAHEITMSRNTLYGNGVEQLLMTHNMSTWSAPPLRNNVLKSNILFAKSADQGIIYINTCKNDLPQAVGIMNNNYYCRPLDDNFIIKAVAKLSEGKYLLQDCDLDGWRASYNQDNETKKTAVQITTHKLKGLIGQNKFFNGEFNTSISGVNVGSTGNSFAKRWVNNDIDGGTFQVETSSTKPGMTTATIQIGAVSTVKKYIIGFSVKNSKDTLVYVYARQAGAPYRVLSNNGAKTILRMTPERKDYEIAFTPTANEANAIVFLETPSQSSKWSIDNIKIYEADVAETNPDDSIRLEYNTTKTARTIQLDGVYTDPKGTVYKNNVAIEPFSSIILIKHNKETTVPSNEKPTVVINTPGTNAKFTASEDITISVSAKDADGSVSKVEFYNGSTLLHTEVNAPYTWSWENVPAGEYVLTAKATDNHGLVAISPAVTIAVSNSKKAPKASITSPVTNTSFKAHSDVKINVSADDADGLVSKVEFYNGNTLIHTEVNAPYNWSWENVPAGNYILTVKATDNDGLETTSAAVTIAVHNPKVAPTVEITTPRSNANFTAHSDVTINVTAADEDGTISKVEFYNGNSLIHTEDNAPYTWSWENVPAGTYVLTAKATDNDGQEVSSSSVTIFVQNPTVTPTVKITTPVTGSGFTTHSDVTINVIATDADGSVSKVEYYNGNTVLHTEFNAPYTWSWENVPAGEHTITAVATDNDGLTNRSSEVLISVTNKMAPELSITSPTVDQSYTSTSTIRIAATANDNDGSIKKVEFYQGTTLLRTERFVPYTYAWKNVPAGRYTITAIATDNDGNTTSSSVQVFVSQNMAPSVEVTSSKIEADYTREAIIRLTAIASDKDGSIAKVEFYNGSVLLRTEREYPYIYSWKNVPSGNYIITAVATDNNGLSTSETIPVTVGNHNRGIATTPTVSSTVISAVETSGVISNKIQPNPGSGLNALTIKVGPNPASSVLSVFTATTREDKELKLTIYSMSGKKLTTPLVKNADNAALNIASLPAGVYILQVVCGTETVNKQFVKQ